MLSNCGAMENDVEIRLKNLGSFWENEPNLRGVLRLPEGILLSLADIFGGGFGLLLGLMLLNRKTNVHLLLGRRGGSVGVHIICWAIP